MSGKKFRHLTGLGILIAVISALVLAACGGGGSSTATGFTQSFTSSAGAGEVLNLSVDTNKMTYSYTIVHSSYGFTAGQTSTGALTADSIFGGYALGLSVDGFIQGGHVFPIQNGLLVGSVNVVFSTTVGMQKVPVLGISNPVTTIAGLATTYNVARIACTVLSGGNNTIPACASGVGTVKVDASGNMTVCHGGNITSGTSACVTTTAGAITATPTPGVYDFKVGTTHIGWFMAMTVANGQRVAIVDFDDSTDGFYGHALASEQVSIKAGDADGKYLVKTDIGTANLISVSGSTVTNLLYPAATDSLVFDSPWTGMVTYTGTGTNAGTDGVAVAGSTGLFAATITSSTTLPAIVPYFIEAGIKIN